MEKLCVIFGAGECVAPRRSLGPDALVIAADGGYAAAKACGAQPDVLIGDFDSGELPETEAHVIKLSRDKDDTDTLAAIKVGIRRGYKSFVIYGGTGGRPDHTFANISSLLYLNSFGAHGYLVFEDAIATVITDETFTLPKSARGVVGVFALGGEARGVTYKNLSYILENATLTPETPLGVSNATAGAPAEITVKSGSLLIFFPR